MIIYFSGTGNSAAIARAINIHFDAAIVALEGDLLLHPETNPLSCDDNIIIWVTPVYSWGLPPVVVNFMKQCHITNAGSARHHLVVTCGDDTGMTATQWRKLMAGREWSAASATSIIMPNTYVLMKGFDTDSPEVEKQKLTAAPEQVDRAIARIESVCNDDEMLRGSFPRIKSYVIYPWFIRHAMSPKPFHATDACISCGKCARNCPMLNITMSATGRPEWSDACALCLRCYHRCPTHAIAYGTATKGKHQYPGPTKQI
ncbi:MAG: EFR1 family ferrodoxin [Muribaculaceae bacterium]|nr:EFR1 family ferrodoxin [Muribaculaceae bacterium]